MDGADHNDTYLNTSQPFPNPDAAAGFAAVASQTVAPAKPAAMKLGCQSTPTTEQHIAYLAPYGVKAICGFPQVPPDRLYATMDELKSIQEMAEKNRVTVDLLAPPFLASISVDRDRHAAIMLGQSPERDRDIEQLQTLIRNCAAGIPAIKYNLCIVGDLRTGAYRDEPTARTAPGASRTRAPPRP